MSTNPYQSPQEEPEPAERRDRISAFEIVVLLFAVAVVIVTLALIVVGK